MQIKICGITTLREVEFVNELKPDYIGLVFAESKRKVNEEKAFQLCKYLNKEIKTVAVFRNNSFEEIKNVLEILYQIYPYDKLNTQKEKFISDEDT